MKLKLTVPNDRMYRLPRYFTYVQQIIEDCRLDESSRKKKDRETSAGAAKPTCTYCKRYPQLFIFSPVFRVS